MNTVEIDQILYNDPYAGAVFQGTYPIDKLPRISPGAYVINLSLASHPGTHWVCVYYTENCLEFFNSYGDKPPKRLLRWWGHTKSYIHNPYRLQSPLTSVCGQFCTYYILHRCQGYTMNQIVSQFTTDVDHNDRQVYDFIRQRYDLESVTLLDTKNVFKQVAQSLRQNGGS